MLKACSGFKNPKYWGIWLGVGLLRLLAFLPWSWRLKTGQVLGQGLYWLAPARRKLALANASLAFPHWPYSQRQKMIRTHFASLGMGLAETATNLWGIHRSHPPSHPKHESHRFHYHGLNHLKNPSNQGTLLVVPHFTTIEATGLMLNQLMPLHFIYRPHDNALMDCLITASRTSDGPDPVTLAHASQPLPNSDTRAIVRVLRQGGNVMILPDQRYRRRGKITAPFFGHDAMSHPGLSKLAKMGHARVLPVFTRRKGGDYHCFIRPALTDFPGKDTQADLIRLHRLYEQEIQQNPAQYLWTHNRWNLKRPRDY
ncbi:MAG: lysophospholipid acyltransferase family protein [Hydrogenovibrio sp.]|uniref:lysophospholipid acyltransferase family protein n=1 Tax=Hydrogenovibrio sp. TaxID=2065821 RepID=UPI0028705010|nr:lysophospholipid acyltransferase family protein [Hydrogenovibrio sp.]MDR9497858.1 lysophospholipid acyltransferase family protein [Hydrogenovibrio sp.]